MKKRAITVIILLAILIPLIIFKEVSILFNMFMILLAGVGIFEMIRTFQTKAPYNKITKYILFLLTMVLTLVIGDSFNRIKEGTYFNWMIASLLIVIVVLGLVFIFDEFLDTTNLTNSFFSIIYIGLGAGGLLLFKNINILLLIYVFSITFITDSFAYFVGISIGKHKMAPKLSPKKSWEGAIAGSLIATTIVGLVFMNIDKIFGSGILNSENIKMIIELIYPNHHLSTSLVWLFTFVVTLILSIFGQIGDLLASKIKREYEVKDFGSVFPGHGGVLDRFDSSFFVSIGLFILVLLFGGL